jgi:hydrogenase expression/formation protein HypE
MLFSNTIWINMNKIISLGHGSGGKLSHDLINSLFVKYFDNPILRQQSDSAILCLNSNNIAFTTDSFVVDPIFFPGGDIGKLAVCGTVNDLSVSGSKPLYLSASFIIEEGLPFESLEKIVESMSKEAKSAGVDIVTGDTKVVDKGKCDKIFINTSGIGILNNDLKHISSGEKISVGDKIIINGSVGNHGMAVIKARELNRFNAEIFSDCASLNSLIEPILKYHQNIHFMRDATRGGLATVIAEMVKGKSFGACLDEDNIKIEETVRGMCDIIGFDPLYVANEGIVVMVVHHNLAEEIITHLKKHPLGESAAVIGSISDKYPAKAWLNTEIGGKRILDMLAGEQLPRIC